MFMGGVAKFAGEECLNRLGNNPLARSSTIHWTVAEIEKVGLNGFRVGGAMVSEMHADFFINCGGTTSKDMLHLLALVIRNFQYNSRKKSDTFIRN
ncbi:hypothetical protein ACFX2J_003353 [Malus domestica]